MISGRRGESGEPCSRQHHAGRCSSRVHKKAAEPSKLVALGENLTPKWTDLGAADEYVRAVAGLPVFTAPSALRVPTSRVVAAPGSSPLQPPRRGSCRTSTAPSPPASTGREPDRRRTHPVRRRGGDRQPLRRGDKFVQLRVVVLRDHRARRSSLRLVGHEYEATQPPGPAAASPCGSSRKITCGRAEPVVRRVRQRIASRPPSGSTSG
jgi:hypothetical protein